MLLLNLACAPKNNSGDYDFRSYLDIQVDEKGRIPTNPYIIRLKGEKKNLSVLGVMHSQDTTNRMFEVIEEEFRSLQPELVIHEGGPITKEYRSKGEAISQDGELGLIKYLCDQEGVQLKSGDIEFAEEFRDLEKQFGREKAYFYYTTERFILPTKYWGSEEVLEREYRSDFVDGYLSPSGVVLSKEEKELAYYRMLYKKYFAKEFKLSELRQKSFSPLEVGSEFCDISRASKRIRDRRLMEEIEKGIDSHQRVLVIFGGWHILAIEPALETIARRY